MPNSNPIDFVLEDFETDVTALKGVLQGASFELLDIDATAEADVSLSVLKIFKYKTEDLTLEEEVNGDDLEYYVTRSDLSTNDLKNFFNDYNVSVNPMVENASINDVAIDYVRYLAKELFNHVKGVDLFSNETEMHENFDGSLNTAVYDNINTVLGNAGTAETPLTNDISNNNVSKKLLDQIIEFDPSRLTDISGEELTIDASHALVFVPLRTGDSISFKLTINSDPNQKDIIEGSGAVDPRSYQIKINVV